MIKKINYLFISLLGIGSLSKIPGSIASLVTTILLFFLFHFFKISPNIILVFVITVFFISLYSVNFYIKNLDDKVQGYCTDEFIGQSIHMSIQHTKVQKNKRF